MKIVEEINVFRYYKPFIEAAGGIGQVKKALAWSEWYAVKWWDEVFNELGLQSIRESVFARALFISLRIRGYIREDGHIRRRPEKPEYPTNSYAIEFVELHESFDRIGAVNVASNKADENTIAILYSTMLSQGWYKILRHTFLKLVEIEKFQTIFEPIIKEGQVALAVMEFHKPKMYIGFDYRRDNVELATAVLKAKPGECKDICIFNAPTSCDAVKLAKKYISGVDAVLMLHTLYWLLDPVKELTCIRSIIGQGGKLLIGQQVVESTPGLVALVTAMGAKHVFSWKGVEHILKAAGYGLSRRYLRYMPYYIAIWEPK
ncbi:family 577 protein [Pyrobaculum islandicum DSM 4184]|uniref:Family 577 protein n=1 Tax=Pyrobaculum islandicum (strain DSM 4184 / JCM 9189 / GEO3) TaxID=384616 RepID=A1RS79_PYRIL|nr:hypothetical protein [Pyrobaculum islandicum]ABL87811.1 family 577 protein [Pyrobaculum islandicum DSM 4184]